MIDEPEETDDDLIDGAESDPLDEGSEAPDGDAAAASAALLASIDWDDAGQQLAGDLTGAELIAALAKRLPNQPGVYRMFGKDGDVLYVGKARSLKKRVANYTRLGGHTQRIARMIRETRQMEFVTTRTETEALLLEANLIKRLRPRYNVLLRDDKSFPYILVSEDHEAPAIMKHRGARSRKGSYFGPFASAGAVGRTINSLQRAFLLRTCTDSVYESRTRPCLLHQIKRCSAPCTGEISIADYDGLVREAKAFLSGR
ncbi:MAG: GIY-YIG nuclease family protein, partial [Aurantimonas coralicida]